ncbi:MAG: hypothetical protein AseanaTS_12560 [Candidatus Pelagadaptatus aseana]|uniref:hypothetical protein n=1 Tax=Candidatus Pelagadaptatus aseana TaxID=3120508 RepID=UPI0039B14622
MKSFLLTLTGFAVLSMQVIAETVTDSTDALSVDADTFECMLDMTKVRHFYVGNLNPDKLEETKSLAEAGQGEYPEGSIVQLVPTEVMVKQPKGTSPGTKDWEFFELNVSAEGTQIHKRGYADVVNRFGGNCLGCHIKAKPEFDMVCEQGHGCDPIPLTRDVIALLQKTDPRCGGRYVPTEQEIAVLKQLRAALSQRNAQ